MEQLADQRSSRSFDAAADAARKAEGSTGAEQGQGTRDPILWCSLPD